MVETAVYDAAGAYWLYGLRLVGVAIINKEDSYGGGTLDIA